MWVHGVECQSHVTVFLCHFDKRGYGNNTFRHDQWLNVLFYLTLSWPQIKRFSKISVLSWTDVGCRQVWSCTCILAWLYSWKKKKKKSRSPISFTNPHLSAKSLELWILNSISLKACFYCTFDTLADTRLQTKCRLLIHFPTVDQWLLTDDNKTPEINHVAATVDTMQNL